MSEFSVGTQSRMKIISINSRTRLFLLTLWILNPHKLRKPNSLKSFALETSSYNLPNACFSMLDWMLQKLYLLFVWSDAWNERFMRSVRPKLQGLVRCYSWLKISIEERPVLLPYTTSNYPWRYFFKIEMNVRLDCIT